MRRLLCDVGGCLSVTAFRIGEGLVTSAERVGEGLVTSAERVGEGLVTSAGLVCTVGRPSGDSNIFWTRQNIEWAEPEVGVTKYNVLTSLYPWSLEEILIEELL